MNRVTMSQFGRWGRAGNQFFQYAFLTEYAQQYGAQLELPAWVGTHLFGASNPSITTKLPVWTEPGSGLQHPTPPEGDELVGKDFRGYAQYHTSYYKTHQDQIRLLFAPVPKVAARLRPAEEQLQQAGETIIGIHLRRGDYGRGIFPIIPTEWYLNWLYKNWSRFKRPVLFIATEALSLVEKFREFNPQTVETLGIALENKPMADCTYLSYDLKTKDSRAMDWYPDFHLLSLCDILLGPSSTFSFFAAMLNPSLQEYWRASLAIAYWQRTDPWDAYPLMREHVNDYPHLSSVRSSHRQNPYWR